MIYFIKKRGTCLTVLQTGEVKSFLLDPKLLERYPAAIDPVVNMMTEKLNYSHPEKFVIEEGDIYAIKRHQIRVYGWFGRFESKKAFFCGHAVLKKTQKFKRAAITRTVEIMNLGVSHVHE